MLDSNLNRIIFWVAIPLGVVGICFLSFRPFSTLELLPHSKAPYSLFRYYDSLVQDGTPTRLFNLVSTPEKISFSYSLGDKELYPYAGVSLHSPKGSYFDFSSFDYVELKLKATKGRRLQLHFSTFATGFTKPDQLMSHRYFLKELDLDSASDQYRIPLADFTTPTWWYNEQKVTEKELKSPEFDKVRVFNVQNCQLLGRNIEDTITVESIRFSKSPAPFYWSSVSFLLIYAAGWFFWYFQKEKSSGSKKIQINYNPVSGKNQFGKELDKVINFISSNYSDPELTLRKIQLGTGVSESKVSALIREKFDLSFKQFLNQLRLNEIKRLLTETDLPIADIAYKVGYGNISHFNRVFKEMEGVSPNDYRKKVKS